MTSGRPVAGRADTLIDDGVCAWAGRPGAGVERLAPATPALGPETPERRRTPGPSAGGAAGAGEGGALARSADDAGPRLRAAGAARAVLRERRRRALGPESGWHRAGCPDWRLNASEADRLATLLEANGWRAEAINLAQGVALVEVRDLAVRGHPLVAVLRVLGEGERFLAARGHGLRGRVPAPPEGVMR